MTSLSSDVSTLQARQIQSALPAFHYNLHLVSTIKMYRAHSVPITEVDALRTYLTESPQQPYEMKPCCLFDRRKGKVTCPSPLGTGVRPRFTGYLVITKHHQRLQVSVQTCPSVCKCLFRPSGSPWVGADSF